MKTLILILTITSGSIFTGVNDKKYESAMEQALGLLYQAQSSEDYQKAANAFERIAQAEKEHWHPAYYATLSYLWKTNRIEEKGELDPILDQAQTNLDLAKAIAPEEDEVIALQGYIYMMRVTVDPVNRGANLGAKSMAQFQKALAIDPENPRALLLMGQMQYGTDQFFGSDTADACEMIKNAVNMLEDEQPAEKFAPVWGKQMGIYASNGCQ